MKKKLHNTAKSFMTEGKVSPDPVGNIILSCSYLILSSVM